MAEWIIEIQDGFSNLKKMTPLVRCKNCRHYKPSEADPNRKMCCRKDVDGFPVCYDFYPADFCSCGERRTDDGEIH